MALRSGTQESTRPCRPASDLSRKICEDHVQRFPTPAAGSDARNRESWSPSPAGLAVDPLTEQIGMTVVVGILAYQVEIDPAKGHLAPALTQERVVQ